MTPEELEKLPKPLERTMTALEMSIMSEIVERIKYSAQITPVTDWLLNRLNVIGASKSRIKKLIGEAIKDADLNIDDIYKQAARSDYIRHREIYEAVGKDYIPYEDNDWLQQVIEAARRQTEDSLRPMENITQTTGFNVPMGGKKVFTPLSEYLERSLDKAMMGITTGTKTYSQAIGDVIDEMTASGVRVVDYASGKSDRIEVAARRAVMTGIAQMTDKVNEKNAEELNTKYWEVDWHMGARNTGTGFLNHQSWQGKVYTTEEMKTVCGLGEMLGFAGINCYHIRFPFIPGISKRKYTDEWLEEQNRKENEKKSYKGKEYDTYAALQHQRKLERTIRKQKQDVQLLEKAGADKEVITAAKSRLRAVNKEYVDFSKEMGIRQQRERLKIGQNYQKEQKQQYAARQAEKFDRLSSYSLDPENKRSYRQKKKAWESKIAKRYAVSEEIKEHREDTPQKMVDLVEKYTVDEFVIFNENAEDAFAYDPDLDAVVINVKHPQYQYLDYREIMIHELAHRIDQNEFGTPMNLRFSTSILNAEKKFLENADEYNKLFEAGRLFEYNRLISDILGCITDNRIVGNYGHNSQYIGVPGYTELEVFADIFSAVYQADDETVRFIKNELPEVFHAFLDILGVEDA